jgi:tetratricopeptide (TPR) repeat protein
MIIRTVAAAAILLLSPLAGAGVADDARALMGQAKYAEALQLLDGHLSKNPQDAEARFTRGLVLVKLNRGDEAVKVFSALTRDYPQLPEPYNNLAVLYAQQGNYEKARDALEAALATHPSYPTAHENLGDIYAALAGAAYNRALMLDQSNTIVRHKLNLIGQLDHVPASATSSASRAFS